MQMDNLGNAVKLSLKVNGPIHITQIRCVDTAPGGGEVKYLSELD